MSNESVVNMVDALQGGDNVAAQVDADAVGTSVTPADDHVDFEIDDDQVVEEE
tara:strand:+ start:68 stop:226 length:159 start_codon:yes stop_codon:yes gene_type:complete